MIDNWTFKSTIIENIYWKNWEYINRYWDNVNDDVVDGVYLVVEIFSCMVQESQEEKVWYYYHYGYTDKDTPYNDFHPKIDVSKWRKERLVKFI